MGKILAALVTTASAIGFAVSASAADLPVKAPAFTPAPLLYNWSGWYVGVNAGYSWGHTDVDYAQGSGLVFGVPPFAAGGVLATNLNPGSFIGGGQIGFNYQTGAWVWGIETDIAWRDRTQSATFNLNPGVNNDSLTLSDEQKWLGTLRGRVGFAPPSMSNWLFYVTGGLAYGGFEHSVTQFCNAGCGQTRIFSDSETRAGWTVGGGVEVALSGNWTVGAEYLYMDFGTETLSAPVAGALGPFTTFPATTVSFHDKSQVARLKLNYKFGDTGLH